MKNLTLVARLFFCMGIAGIGALQFYYGGFRPVLVPYWPTWLPGMLLCAYLAGALLILFGICIFLNIKARNNALLLGAFFLIFLLIAEIPYMLIANPNPWHLGSWT